MINFQAWQNRKYIVQGASIILWGGLSLGHYNTYLASRTGCPGNVGQRASVGGVGITLHVLSQTLRHGVICILPVVVNYSSLDAISPHMVVGLFLSRVRLPGTA